MTATAKTSWRKRRTRLRIRRGRAGRLEVEVVEVGLALKRENAILLLMRV